MSKVSPKTITRSLLYIRTLNELIKSRRDFVSSGELAKITGLTDVQIRKDISFFGKAGKPRVGYNVRELKKLLEDFIVKHVVRIALFGAGNLGTAILKYPGFHKDKLKVIAAFDKDKKKIGKFVNGVKIHHIDDAKKVLGKNPPDIGVIAVPEKESQEIAGLISSCGIKGIVNFAPTSINAPKKVAVKDIDLSIEFLSVYCKIQK
jgi:redox-sensing transcriptional repressor